MARRTIGHMPEVLATVPLAAFIVLLLWAMIPKRTDRAERVERAVNANHHGLYLLVNDLVTTQERGLMPVFPDQASLDDAKQLLADYRQSIVAQAPPRPATGMPLPQWESTRVNPPD